MGLQVELLQESFRAVLPKGEEFTAAFYERLFAMYPDTEPMFANASMKEQRRKLLSSLVLVIENLTQPEVLTSALKRLGAQHVGYQVKPEHYDMVGAALVETLAAFLPDRWNDELQVAWIDAYAAVTSLMLAGASSVDPVPAA